MVSLRSLSCWKDPSVLEHKDMYRWLNILVQDFLVEHRMNGSINYGKSSGSWSSKASPDVCTITTRLDCCYDVHFIRCCVSFRLNVTRFILSEKLHFCSSLDVVLGSFVTSCDFGRLTTPGNVHHCIMFHAHTMVQQSPQAFCNPFQTDWCQWLNYFSRSCFLTSFSLLHFVIQVIFQWFLVSETELRFPKNVVNRLKMTFCIYLHYLCLILKSVWWSETRKCVKYTKNLEIRKDENTFS